MPNPRMPQLQGIPIWFNLTTPDPVGAKDFYSGLFGWEWADVPMSGGNTYHMAIRDDANIAGMSGDVASTGGAGCWVNHVYAKDAEDAAKRIEANGGRVLSGPHNADGWGVTATVATPEGAVFGLWQSLNGYGADLFAEPGTICWIEYHSHDLPAAKEFYTAVFECDFGEVRMPAHDGSGEDFGLTMVDLEGEHQHCAFLEAPDKLAPASWATYFMVEDAEASVAKAESLGAESLTGVIAVPPGSFAMMKDPQGVGFNFWQPAE